MAWEIPKYTLADVDNAGELLVHKHRDEQEYTLALKVIDNWRAVHAFPLNTMQVYLRKKASIIDHNAIVAQRIKRLTSIELKLRHMPELKLSEMQDIGGCRAVVRSVAAVKKLVKAYHDSDIKHKLDDWDDYIKEPKLSGYRSYHLIYRYYSDKKSTYNDRKIEMQLRSKLQHVWATAVETVGTFTGQALKSSIGAREWLRFFQLMGTVIALKEGTAPVPNTPTDNNSLLRELRDCATSLQVETKLSAYGAALHELTRERHKAHFYLLALNPVAKTIRVREYKKGELSRALRDYTPTEQGIRKKPGGEAVLVSVDSMAALRSAYPNYFLDTVKFREELQSALSGKIGK